MSFIKYIEPETMHKLVEGIQQNVPLGELGNVRYELLIGIDPGFVADLSSTGNARTNILIDLNTMNTVSHLLGGEVPLKVWLINAVNRLRASHRPQTSFFQQILEDVTAQSQKIIAEESGQDGDRLPLGGQEQIVHKDDMLSFGWLMGALGVGRSVVRLQISRYEGEQPTGTKYNGTGWLIGKQHLITNHHVINARSDGESAALEADLRLQAISTAVVFDNNDVNVEGVVATVEALCAWRVFHETPSLDYAILKLADPITDRTPLTLAPKKLHGIGQILNHNQDDRPPVNIIQHPSGQAKMLGVRNNQVYQLTKTELSYFTDTEGGSSGSPVCDDDWQVVALHRGWHLFYQGSVMFQGKTTAWENRGIRIDCIVDDLRKNYSDLWNEISAVVIE